MPAKARPRSFKLNPRSITDPIAATQNAADFMDAVKEGYKALYQHLLGDPKQQKKALDQLDEALASFGGEFRARRLLELCAWPLMDKPGLPVASGELPEFLWLFAVPFVVTLSPSALEHSFVPQEETFQPMQFLQELQDTNWVNDNAQLRVLSNLFRREDLHCFGPRALAAGFMRAENDEPHNIHPSEIPQSAGTEGGRVVTLVALCAARLPIGERVLLNREQAWPAERFASMMKRQLNEHGLRVDAVASLPPCSMAEVAFKCRGAGVIELAEMLRLARAKNDGLNVTLRFEMEGMATLYSTTSLETEVALAPPFSFIEPKAELAATIKQLCETLEIKFSGAFSLVTAAPTALQ